MLDEPSQGPVPKLVAEVLNTIEKMRSEIGLTILLVEQNVRMVLELPNRAYVVEKGRIVKQGDSRNMLDDRHIREAYLGTESV